MLYIPLIAGIAANNSCIYGTIKLVGDDDYSGKVEICINHMWTSICNNNWDEKDAIVACRQLGFSQG